MVTTALPEGSVLDKDTHARLLQDLDSVCEIANIPKYLIHQSAKTVCNDDELEWVRNFASYRETGKGMVIVGDTNIGPDMRLMAMTAALLRNFIDARVMPLNGVLEMAESGDVTGPTVLMIPNLYVNSFGKQLTAWKVQQLYDLLLSRFTQGRPTVAYVESMHGLKEAYGPQIANHLEQHFKIVTHKH
jgi:hypothetical protein